MQMIRPLGATGRVKRGGMGGMVVSKGSEMSSRGKGQ